MKVQFKRVHTFTGHLSSVFALSNYKTESEFITGDGGGYAVLWDLENVGKGEALASAGSNIFALQYLKDLNELVIGTMGGTISFIDTENKQLTQQINPSQKAIFDFLLMDKILFAGSETGKLLAIDLESKKMVNQYNISNKSLRSVQYYPSQHHLIIGTSDHNIYRFDIKKEKIISTLSHHTNSVFTVNCLDKETILSGSRDAHLNIWKNDELFESLPAHNYTINHIAVAPNRKLFATAGKDKTIKIFNSTDFKLLKVIDASKTEMHTNSVNKLLWTDYNNYLISVSDDRNIMVWEIF